MATIDNSEDKKENNVMNNVQYLCKASDIINESLKDGKDVAQLPNGNIIVRETKIITTCFTWDDKKQKMVKTLR